MKAHESRFDVELVREVEADIRKLGGLQVVGARGIAVPDSWVERGGGLAVIREIILERVTLWLQSRVVEGAARVLVYRLLPVQTREPVEAPAGFGKQAQLVRPALGVGVVFVVLKRDVAAAERLGRGAVVGSRIARQ